MSAAVLAIEETLRAGLRSVLLERGRAASAADRFLSELRPLLERGLTSALAADEGRTAEIRRFYLEGRASYALRELADLWRIPLDEVCAIFADRIAARLDCGGGAAEDFEVSWIDALGASTVFHVFPSAEVQHALGDDFDRAFSPAWRPVPIVLNLPRFIVDTLSRIPQLPSPGSLEGGNERIICDYCEAEHLAKVAFNVARSGAGDV